MDDSPIICDDIIDADADAKLSPKDVKLSTKDDDGKTETISTIFNKKKLTYITQVFYVLLPFY